MNNYLFTVNTDASYHPDTGVAGWAYWIKSDHYHMTKAGLLTEENLNSGLAELLAVRAAADAIWKQIDDEPFLQYYGREGGISIIFNTDCKFVIDAYDGKVHSPGPQEMIAEVKLLLEGFNVKFHHVKAHTRNPAARSWVNRWCDREARKVVRERVKQLDAERTKEKV